MEDLSGRVFGGLQVLGPEQDKSGFWHCRCGCGRELSVAETELLDGSKRSCGCGRKRLHCGDITGMRSGRLVALERLNRKRGSSFLWRCQCDCGNTVETSANSLLSGNTRSCGCLRVEAIRRTNAKHGSVSARMRLVDGTCVDCLERGRLQRNNTSGCTGVQARGDKWIAVITFKKQVHYLGIFDNKEEAIRVRKEAEKHYFGSFPEEYYENGGRHSSKDQPQNPDENPAPEENSDK